MDFLCCETLIKLVQCGAQPELNIKHGGVGPMQGQGDIQMMPMLYNPNLTVLSAHFFLHFSPEDVPFGKKSVCHA